MTGGVDAPAEGYRSSTIVVTGDKAVLALKTFRKVKMFSLRAYLEDML